MLGANVPVGVKIALSLAASYATLPPTGVSPGLVTVKVESMIVVGSIASLKVAVTF